jgi:hypothetical protein
MTAGEVEINLQFHHDDFRFSNGGRDGINHATNRAFGIQNRSVLLAFALGAVLGTGLFAVGDALGVEDAADDVIADAG